MIQLVLIIAGVVGLALREQFHGQYAIAAVLLGLGVLLLFLQWIATVLAFRRVKRSFDSFHHRRGL